MKPYLNILLLFLALLTAAGCSQRDHEHAAGETQYTCPMHPQIVQNGPGTCPICKMDLVPKSGHSEGMGMAMTEDLAFLLKPTTSTVVADIATVRPEQKSVPDTLRLDGIITYDPRQVYSVPARIGGRIERLYVQYNFQPVRKGQKLLELYSPELITAQQELLYLVQSAPEDQQLQAAAKQKLRLLGVTQAQISSLVRTGKASYSFALYSPHDGYVIGLNTAPPASTPAAGPAAAPAAGGGMAGMGGGSAGAGTAPAAAPVAEGADIPLREGMYVSAGQPLVRVVNPRQLWAEFNVAAGAAQRLSPGTPLQISFPQLPGEHMQAKVSFLQPYYQQGENFAKVRVYLPGNQKGMLVGQLVSARASYTTDTALWVPREAVLDIGTRAVAFKKSGGVFEPVLVTRGVTAGHQTQIVSGLQAHEVIAANAQFLVDSESFIKVNK